MVTESGIWFTDECGRSWRRIYKQRGLTDVRFVSRERGWAIGSAQDRYRDQRWREDLDAGEGSAGTRHGRGPHDLSRDRVCQPRKSASCPPNQGVPNDSKMPLVARSRATRSAVNGHGLSVSLETHDGGATWSTNKVSMFGRISRIRVAKDGRGLALGRVRRLL